MATVRLNNEIQNKLFTLTEIEKTTKSEIIKWYIEHDYPINDLYHTTSCYHPVEMFCGSCPSCFRKWCAFHDNGIADILGNFNNNGLVSSYIDTIENYDAARQRSIISAAVALKVIN